MCQVISPGALTSEPWDEAGFALPKDGNEPLNYW
jgi:hypothetical protein